MTPKYDVAWATDQTARDRKTKFVFFWGHKARKDGALDDALFSQWYPAGFGVQGTRYPTSEHWMMAEKARLFGDQARLADILATDNPGKAKAMGRQVAGFDGDTWAKAAYSIVYQGNRQKFRNSKDRAAYLLRTGDKILVEASPLDPIWGIGLSAQDPAAQSPKNWQGTNLLGFALMEVRDTLRADTL